MAAETTIRCQRKLMAAGGAYPKSCEVCGLGPCRDDPEAMKKWRAEVVGRWADTQRAVFKAEDALATAIAERNQAANACEDAGITPWGTEVPRRG